MTLAEDLLSSQDANTWFAVADTFVRSTNISKTVIMVNAQTGTPVLVSDVATVTFGPDMRRGVAELDGKGEVVAVWFIMRYGENAEKVIERTKEKLNDLKSTLPPGVKLVTTMIALS